MKTQEALTRFMKKCEERGLAADTRRTYYGYLRHLAEEHPDLPTDPRIIEAFLKKRKETPAHRGAWFRMLQAFYSYLETFEGIASPVPPKGTGKVGRPRKVKLVTSPATEQLGEHSTLTKIKLVTGGQSVSSFTSISTLEAVEALVKSRKAEGISKRTVDNYHSYFKPFIRKFPILPVTVEPIEEFLGSIRGTPETRWTYRRNLVALYHFLEARKRIPKELFQFPRVKVPRKVRRVLAEEDLRRLFQFTENFQEKAILTLLIDSKIRRGEVISLTRENTHPDYIIVTGKTGQRQVPISPDTYGMLIQLAAKGPLFQGVKGRPMNEQYLRLMIHRLMVRSGLEGKKLGPQILRHSASVQHMRHGGDLKSLQGELGHTTTKMTDIYAELAYTDVKEAHDRVDVLGKIAGPLLLERARCYGCGQEVVAEFIKIKETECPNCHQVGKWYLPNHRTEG